MTIYEAIKRERQNQDEKWGEQNHNGLKWLAILMEEIGECSELINELYLAIGESIDVEDNKEFLRHELIQVAAVCVAWLESIKRNSEVS